MLELKENFELFAPKESIVFEKLAKITATIAVHNFEWRYITLLLFNSSILEGIEPFLKVYNKSVITTIGLKEPRYAEETRQFVIFGRNIKDISVMLDWMGPYIFDNTGRHIVICESHDCDETDAVNTFWYHKITNVVFLNIGAEVKGYTYYFSKENCAMSAPVKIDLDFCMQKMSECVLYPEKFNNLYECPLIASTFQQTPYMDLKSGELTGCDGKLLGILAEALNATLQIMTPHRGDGWGALDPINKTWVGSLADVYYDLANISMTSAALTQHRFSNFQQSYYYNFVIIGWITNPTELESSSLKLIHPFNKETHIAVALTFIIVIMCSLLISSKLWKRFKRRIGVGTIKKNNIIFLSWMIFMGIPTAKLPKKPFLLYLAFLWIWYTFMVRTFYQASLINSLKSNVYASNLDTIEDMLKAKVKFGGGYALRDYFINYPEVYNKFIGMNASELQTLATKVSRSEEKFALAVNLEAVTAFYLNRGGSFHIVPEKIVVSPTAIFFKKFSPLAYTVNKNLRRLVEAGISDNFYRTYIGNPKKLSKESSKEALTVEHYTGCYAILFAGWSMSFLIFICEVIMGFRNKIMFI